METTDNMPNMAPFEFRNNTIDEERLSRNLDAFPAVPHVRRNQSATDDDFRQTFKAAIQTLIERGTYSNLVNIHADMRHRMHTMRGMGLVGSMRFLPWHRAYLQKLEIELRVIDMDLYIPYWDWTRDQDIPDWISDFLPTGVVDSRGRAIEISRQPGADPDAPTLPTPEDIQAVKENDTYLGFTLALEGARPFGAHNQVHLWVGGTMTQIPTAPADPLFWLHHAFVDLCWHQWQGDHPGQQPRLRGSAAVLDPWPDTVTDVETIARMGYDYQ